MPPDVVTGAQLAEVVAQIGDTFDQVDDQFARAKAANQTLELALAKLEARVTEKIADLAALIARNPASIDLPNPLAPTKSRSMN